MKCEAWLQHNPLNAFTVLDYFALSNFYDPVSVNELAVAAGRHRSESRHRAAPLMPTSLPTEQYSSRFFCFYSSSQCCRTCLHMVLCFLYLANTVRTFPLCVAAVETLGDTGLSPTPRAA